MARYEALIKEITTLLEEGVSLLEEETESAKKSGKIIGPNIDFLSAKYEKWYTLAHRMIKQTIPERLSEFEAQYNCNKPGEAITCMNYSIRQYIQGCFSSRVNDSKPAFDHCNIFYTRFQTQIGILLGAKAVLESRLSDIAGVIESEMFSDELEAASELVDKGYYRAAGALAGVTLERTLKRIASERAIVINSKKPTLADYNDALKSGNILDTPKWRFIQHLGDIRNLCDHLKEREPTKEEINALIDGVKKVTKTYP
ncbi:MAG: hypothetical protein WC551_12105 [Patescibacteria group bacterium]